MSWQNRQSEFINDFNDSGDIVESDGDDVEWRDEQNGVHTDEDPPQRVHHAVRFDRRLRGFKNMRSNLFIKRLSLNVQLEVK